jgi:tetratricopeptide (TPR) repeat protein
LLAAACGRRAVIVPATTAQRAPNPDSLYEGALRAFHQGTPESYTLAAELFRTAWFLKPDRCEFALNRAQALLFLATEQLLNWEEFQPRQTEAASVVDSVQSGCIASHEPFVLRLRALLAGRGPAATDLINRAVDLDPRDAMNWVVLGYLDPASPHLVNPEGTGRWVAMTRAAELKPDSALIQYEIGNNYQAARGREREAREAFRRAIASSPRHFRAYLGLAFSSEDSTDVEPLYQQVVQVAPAFLEGRMAFGGYYGALEEIGKAVEQYSAAVALNPKYDIAYFRLGLLMLDAARPIEAEQHFRKVVELNPGSYEAHYRLGNIAYGRTDYDEAKRRYEQALRIRVSYPEAMYGAGWVYRQQNQPDLALAEFDRAIRIQPRYGDAYLSRADSRAERRQFQEALADYEKAIETYEEQIKGLNAAIAAADARPQSRIMQVEKKQAERDKARAVAVLERARSSRSEAAAIVRALGK